MPWRKAPTKNRWVLVGRNKFQRKERKTPDQWMGAARSPFLLLHPLASRPAMEPSPRLRARLFPWRAVMPADARSLGALGVTGGLATPAMAVRLRVPGFPFVERGLRAFHVFGAFAHEHPVVDPHVSHFMQVPLRTSVKLPHSPQASPS